MGSVNRGNNPHEPTRISLKKTSNDPQNAGRRANPPAAKEAAPEAEEDWEAYSEQKDLPGFSHYKKAEKKINSLAAFMSAEVLWDVGASPWSILLATCMVHSVIFLSGNISPSSPQSAETS